jgi:hypothetical protein
MADTAGQPSEIAAIKNENDNIEKPAEEKTKDNKTLSKDVKEKTKDRMDSLTKMFLSGADEEEE